MMFLLAHRISDDPEAQEKDKEDKADEDWNERLKQAQERSQNKITNKEQIVKESQEKLLNMIEKEKE